MKFSHSFSAALPVILAISAIANCLSAEKIKVPDSNLQAQRSLLLSATRYIDVFEAIKGHEDLKDIQKDLDWWIDLSILQLIALESAYPEFDWANVDMDSYVNLKAKKFYRQIANYRIAQPHLLGVSLKASEIEMIKVFTEKYINKAEQGAAANP